MKAVISQRRRCLVSLTAAASLVGGLLVALSVPAGASPVGAPPSHLGGSVEVIGDDALALQPPDSLSGQDVTAVAAGDGFDVALTAAGQVVSWGDIADPPSSLDGTQVTAIAAGADYALALTSAGNVVAWGAEDQGQTNVPDGLSDVVAIAAGTGFGAALTGQGDIVDWGGNAPTVPDDLGYDAQNPVQSIAASSGYIEAIQADNTVAAFGYYADGNPVSPPNPDFEVTSLAAAPSTGYAVATDGSVQGFGEDIDGSITQTPSLDTATAVAGGDAQFALDGNGQLHQWGNSDESIDSGVNLLNDHTVQAIASSPDNLDAVAIIAPDPITTGPRDDYQTVYISQNLGYLQQTDDTLQAYCSVDAPDNSGQYDQALVGLSSDTPAFQSTGEYDAAAVSGVIASCRPFVDASPTLDTSVAPTQQIMSDRAFRPTDSYRRTPYANQGIDCPAGQVINGFEVASSQPDAGSISDLEPFCSALDADGRTTTNGVAAGWLNGGRGFYDGLVQCPAGSFVVGIQGDGGDYVDDIGIVCNAPDFTAQQPDNSAWTTATTLKATDTTTQALTTDNGALWYRFPIQPDTEVRVDLTNLPVNDDLALFSDITQAYATLNSTQDLTRVSAESAGVKFSPATFSPATFSPATFSPATFSPATFSPATFSPATFSPATFSPATFSPATFSPATFSPDVTPGQYTNPGAFADTSTFEQAYSSAQTRSVLAVSANDGLAPESISGNTGNFTGYFYIRVTARNGVGSPTPYTLSVLSAGGPCTTPLDNFSGDSTITGTPGSASTVVLTDSSRLGDSAALTSADNAFASSVPGGAAIVDLADSQKVRDLNAQADAHPECSYAKDMVAQAIRDIVNSYRDLAGTLKYVVIQGGDAVVPFFRYLDNAGIAAESGFVPPVASETASASALFDNQVLSDDAYGSQIDLAVASGGILPVPDLSVGRLVGGPGQIATTLTNYTDGTTRSIDVHSSLSTGYDFLADAAKQIAGTFAAGDPSGTNDTLITNDGVPREDTTVGGVPSPTTSWTATDLKRALLTKRHDLIYLAAHSSPNLALAADYSTVISTHDVAAASPTASSSAFLDSLIISPGCHSGYDIVDQDGVPGVTDPLDWTTEFADQGATLIAGTGYQYGDTDFVKYSNELYTELATELRTGSGPVSIGGAFVKAKADYLSAHATLDGIDQKSLLEATLYGLPMQTISQPDQLTPPAAPTPLSTTPETTDPGQTLGLSQTDVTINPNLTQHTKTLTSTGGGTVTATYYSGDNGIRSVPAAPTLPLVTANATAPSGTVLRGAGFWSGTYTDTDGITPLTGAPATETNTPHGPFVSDVFYPNVLATPNYFGVLTGTGGTTLQATPAQYMSDAPGSLTDTQRVFSSLGYRLFYSGNTQTYGSNTPALAAPPSMSATTATLSADGSSVAVSTHVVGDPSAGIQEVWVTYTDPQDPGTKHWTSIDLTQDSNDSTLWTGSIPLSPGQNAGDLRYLVQAVNGVGVVGADDNAGHYYAPIVGTTTTPDATSLQLRAGNPSEVVSGTTASISAKLSSGGDPVVNQPVLLRLGASSVIARTDSGGVASASVPVVDGPGTIPLSAAFAGTSDYASSGDGPDQVTVDKREAALSLDVNAAGATVTLTDQTGANTILASRSVFVVATGSDGSVLATVPLTTGADGTATLLANQIPTGTDGLQAYFGSPSTPTRSGDFDETDPVYTPAVSDEVSFTPSSRFPVTNTVPVPADPTGVAVDPRTHQALVTAADGSLTALTAAGDVHDIVPARSGTDPAAVATDPKMGLVYVADHAADAVSVFSESDGSLVRTVNVGNGPSAVALDPRTHDVYVTDSGDGAVSVIDGTTGAVSTIPVGTDPSAVAIDPAAHQAFVTNAGSGNVSVIDETSRTVTTTVAVGTAPSAVAIDPLLQRVVVTNAGAGTVSVLSEVSDTVLTTLDVGSQPSAVAIDTGSHLAYVANLGDDTVSVLDVAASTVLGTVGVGAQPAAVAVDPTSHLAYVLNAGDASASVITPAGLMPQTIMYKSMPPRPARVGGSYMVIATGGGSGNPVTFVVPAASAQVCSLVDNGNDTATVTFLAAGRCTIVAKQTGNSSYLRAVPKKQQITVR